MLHGIINVYKEKGFTSHDVVAKLRGIAGQKKIGHTGTLDPDATGVLPVCLGKATKLCDLLTDQDKTYETVLLFGKVTDTQDMTGTVLKEASIEALTEENVRAAVRKFEGEYDQIPPMYSALKVNGKKLYELAREGVEIERKARKVRIHKIMIKEISLPRVRMEVTCSKGTYIRTLCHDIGAALGCGACMEELVRTRVGRFQIEDSLTLDGIAKKKEAGTLQEVLLPIDQMFSDDRKVNVKEKHTALVYNGNPFFRKHAEQTEGIADGESVRVYDHRDRFIGIYCYDKEHQMFRIRKMFYDKEE